MKTPPPIYTVGSSFERANQAPAFSMTGEELGFDLSIIITIDSITITENGPEYHSTERLLDCGGSYLAYGFKGPYQRIYSEMELTDIALQEPNFGTAYSTYIFDDPRREESF